VAWPSAEDLWKEDLVPAQRAFTAMCAAIADLDPRTRRPRGERIELLVPDEERRRAAMRALEGLGPRTHAMAFGDIWLRDTAPIFLLGESGEARAACFAFNGWGGKYVLPDDDRVAERVAAVSGARPTAYAYVLEGGSVEVDGEGTLLTTRQCLLHPNRNPSMTPTEVEASLRDSLGVEKVLWLDEGLMNDHTDGHIDTVARFVAPGVVVCMEASGDDDPNARVLEAIGLELEPMTDARLEGEYYIDSRRLGGRNLDPKKYERDRDLLLAEVARNPGDARSVFYLAQSYFDAGDHANALEWYRKRTEMGGWEEEVYYALFRCGECRVQLGASWPEVTDAYLRAWEYRPARAEPLHALAREYRIAGRYQLGYLFAERAASIPLPTDDALFVGGDVYAWRARDEQAICAYWIGKHMESFALCRLLLAGPDLPEAERERVAENRDFAVPALLEAATTYPDVLIGRLSTGRGRQALDDAGAVPTTGGGTTTARAAVGEPEITLTIETGPDRGGFAAAFNSFLRCCVDVPRIDRFVAVDTGLGAADRAWVAEQYPFMEVVGGGEAPGAMLRVELAGPFWLRIPAGWRFFAPERYVGRALEVLDAEPGVAQVAINLNDAEALAGRRPAPAETRQTPAGSRYVPVPGRPQVRGPVIILTAAFDRAAGRADGLPTASFDEVLCVRAATGATD